MSGLSGRRLVNIVSPLWQCDRHISRTCVQVRLFDCSISLSPGRLSLSNLTGTAVRESVVLQARDEHGLPEDEARQAALTAGSLSL